MFEKIVVHAANRYRSSGLTAWFFARGKLRGDPVYRAVWEGPWLPRGGTVMDVGCGQGLMLAVAASARVLGREGGGERGSGGNVADGARLVGIETRGPVAEIARRALGAEAEIIAADVRTETLPVTRTILVFDVLHMMQAADQESLVRGLVAALEPGGTLLLREVDAGAGWRFQAVNVANRMKALVLGYSSREFCFRTAGEWRGLLESHGLRVEVQPMGKGTPYGNVLFAGTKAGGA